VSHISSIDPLLVATDHSPYSPLAGAESVHPENAKQTESGRWAMGIHTKNAAGFGLLMLGAACADVDSKSIDTDGIVATYKAISDGDKARGRANLAVGGQLGTQVDLSDGDELTVTYDSETQVMEKSKFLTIINYDSAWRTGPFPEGTLFTFAFDRDVKISAPDSTVNLPSPFTITSSPPASPAAPGETFAVELDNAEKDDEGQSWSISGTCIGAAFEDFSGSTATVTIPAASTKQEKTCDVTVTIDRTRSGTADPALDEDSSVTGIQRRELPVFEVHVPAS
jgi:hypothetical protein